MNIVYLVFGESIVNYQQVCFSIYTALNRKETDDKVIIITEDASLFKHLGDRVEVLPINRTIIKEWEGEYKFFWRVKIKALELVASKYPEQHILYMDGDTFIYKDLSLLKTEMNKGQNFMHLNEGKMCELPTKTEKLMWKQIKGKVFGGITMDETVCMWNAGLIGISAKHLNCLTLCLQINDEMCKADVTRRLIEQFAFSLGTNAASTLKPGDHVVGHYWGNKDEWNELISDFMKRALMTGLTIEQMLDEVKDMKLENHAIWVRRSNTQRKLKNAIDNFYKDKRAVFVK